MKLYTHNMMISPVKGITKNYPLGIEADAVEERDVDFDAQFIKHILPTIDYPVLLASAQQVTICLPIVFGVLNNLIIGDLHEYLLSVTR